MYEKTEEIFANMPLTLTSQARVLNPKACGDCGKIDFSFASAHCASLERNGKIYVTLVHVHMYPHVCGF